MMYFSIYYFSWVFVFLSALETQFLLGETEIASNSTGTLSISYTIHDQLL